MYALVRGELRNADGCACWYDENCDQDSMYPPECEPCGEDAYDACFNTATYPELLTAGGESGFCFHGPNPHIASMMTSQV
eukprot:UN06096